MSEVQAASLGAALGALLCFAGSAYGIAYSSPVARLQYKQGATLKKKYLGLVPSIQAAVLSSYGVIIGVIVSTKIHDTDQFEDGEGYKQLGAGLATGFGSLFAGIGMGIYQQRLRKEVEEGNGQYTALETDSVQPVVTPRVILVGVFFECIGLFGLIAGLTLSAS